MREFRSLTALAEAAGEHLGYSGWRAIDQQTVDLFAQATGDEQWIHVDPERAAQGPFKGTIAHGFLTLSLLPVITADVYRVHGVRMAVNYGLNKVRFPSPVRVGSRVRGGVELLEVAPVEGGVQVVARVTVEIEGGSKPACVAESVARVYQ